MSSKEYIVEDLGITNSQRKSRSDFYEFGTPQDDPLTQEQLDLIPDIIDGHVLDKLQKTDLALGMLEFQERGEFYEIKDDKILKRFITENLGTDSIFLQEDQVEFTKQNLTKDQIHHLDIQKMQLEQWKSVLKPDVYNQVEDYVLNSNKNLTEGKEVLRGGMIDEYIDTIMHEIYKANRKRFEKYPAENYLITELGEKIKVRWENLKDKVDEIVSNNKLANPLRALKLNEIKVVAIQNEVADFIKNYEPIGQLKSVPIEVIGKLFENQVEQSWGVIQTDAFEANINAQQEYRGFDWEKTENGKEFWENVIINEDYTTFFKEYPKSPVVDNAMIEAINNFLETYVPKGEIVGYPKEVLAKLLIYQTTQQTFETMNFKERIAKFEQQYDMPLEYGGFDSWQTVEGEGFWADVQHDRNFELYFERYPKGSAMATVLETKEDHYHNPFAEANKEDRLQQINYYNKLELEKIPPFLAGYTPQGDLANFPKEVIEKILENQVNQYFNELTVDDNLEGINLTSVMNVRDFEGEKRDTAFDWAKSSEGINFWESVILEENFATFFEIYPEQKYDNEHLRDRGFNR